MSAKRCGILVLMLVVAGCHPATTRPGFMPVPESVAKDVELSIVEATRVLAVALNADSIPVKRTEPVDGWLESEWFDAKTYRPTSARRLGDQVVKVRAWVDPSEPNFSTLTIETVYRPLADPSREGRTLERMVPGSHPVAMKVFRILDSLARKYGKQHDDR